MKQKQTLMAAVLLLVLLFLYWATQTGRTDTKSVDASQFRINPVAISRITIQGEADTAVFQRGQAAWILEDYPVDTTRMENLLDELSALSVDRVISTRAENHAKYELDENAPRILMEDENGGLLLNLLIGKQGANERETFVRAAASDEVLAVKTNLLRYRSFSPGFYWDRTLTDFNRNALIELEFSGELNYSLRREDTSWTYDGEAVDFEKIDNLIQPLENLKATNFSDLSLDDTHPFYQAIHLKLEDGSSVELRFHLKAENASTLLVQVSGKSKLFEYTKSGLNRFKKSLADLQVDAETAG